MRNFSQGKQQKIVDLIPSSWFTRPLESSIWLTTFKIFRIQKDRLKPGPKIIDLPDVRAFIMFGKLNYFDSGKMYFKETGENQLQLGELKAEMKETSEGSYLLLITPFDVDGIQGNEGRVKERIKNISALLAVFNGRNIIYEKVFENIIEISTGNVTAFSSVAENPLWFPIPDISDSRLLMITKANDKLLNLTHADKTRIFLSLHWFESAVYESGTDAFLKYWIALETLGMPNTSNIRPLNEIISSAYSLGIEPVSKRFGVGRLFGLRSRIVHDGQMIPIHALLLKYIEALYADIFMEIIGIPCEFRAESILNNPEFSLDKFLHE